MTESLPFQGLTAFRFNYFWLGTHEVCFSTQKTKAHLTRTELTRCNQSYSAASSGGKTRYSGTTVNKLTSLAAFDKV